MVLVKKMKFQEEHIQKIRDNGVVIYADYWKPNVCSRQDKKCNNRSGQGEIQ